MRESFKAKTEQYVTAECSITRKNTAKARVGGKGALRFWQSSDEYSGRRKGPSHTVYMFLFFRKLLSTRKEFILDHNMK